MNSADATDRNNAYAVQVKCIKGCGIAAATVKQTAGQWSINIVGDDVFYGDGQFIVIVSDQFYSSVSYPIDVRVIRAPTLDNKGQCQ